MALTGAMYTGVSGLSVNQTWLNVIGNNIANSNTTGFKSSRTQFKPQFYVTDSPGSAPDTNFGGSNPSQEGLGAVLASIEKNFNPGAIQSTGQPTDMAIDGDGFFVVKGSSQLYTRDGNFTLNSNHELVTGDGQFVQGYGADTNGVVQSGALTNIVVPLGANQVAKATQDASMQGNLNASGTVMAPLAFLVGNDFEPVDIQSVDLTIESTEQPKTATIERVWLDGVRAKAGKTVPLKVLMRNYRGEEVIRTVPLDIPANATGSLQVMVSDGSRLAQWERREVRQPTEPRSVSQMIRALNTARKNNRLYVRLLASDAGAVISGEPLSSLPPSVLGVLESDRSAGDFVPLRSATLREWDMPMEYVVIGSRTLTLTLDAN